MLTLILLENFFSVLSNLRDIKMQKVELVFVPAPFTGHIFSAVEFAKHLLEKDDRLSATVLLLKSPFAPFNMEQVVASNANIRFVEIPQADPPPQQLLKAPEKYISDYMENHNSHVKDALVNHVLSDSTPVAGLVYDVFCSSMIDVANELGIPSYVFFTSGATYLGLLFHLPLHYDRTGRKFMISDPDSIIPTFAYPVPSRVLPSFTLNDDGNYESFMKHAVRMKKSKGIIINTFLELEPQAIKSLSLDGATSQIYTIGPVLNPGGHVKSGTETEKIMEWLDKQPRSSVVFLCFGSMGGFERPQLAEIATALEQIEHRFLWSVRRPQPKDISSELSDFANLSDVLPNRFIERTKNKGLVCGWAPQMEVLGHEAVGGFVSHCGWNSTLESIWHGVPIATWPLYAEQQTNAFLLVKELELAVELKLDYRVEDSDKVVMADEIERAIRSLMDDENPVRKRMKETGERGRKAMMDGGSSFKSMRRLIQDFLIKKA